ncbi:hypothetical protein JCM11251_004594 [Rhodosporidiobolus azoricus]
MHATLPTHVLALAPDSLASLGELDNDSLSELWSLFTRCKDSLQNGRRLENLSWRLLYRIGRRDGSPCSVASDDELTDDKAQAYREQAVEAGWSDPEWEEASDSEVSADDEQDEEEAVGMRGRQPVVSTRSSPAAKSPPVAAPQPPRGRTASVPADPSGASKEAATCERPAFGRGVSREWKSAPVISGPSLQRMIADLQRMPEIPPLGKARSLHEVSGLSKPPLGSRGSSAPDVSLSRPVSPPPAAAIAAKVDALTQTTPGRSRRTSPVRSPCMSRSASTPSHATVSNSSIIVTAPTPAPLPSRRVPSKLTMSAIPSPRRSRPSTPSPPTPQPSGIRMTPSETAMLALSNSRNQSDANLVRRSQSTAELAASFKPASYVKGFDPSPSSLEAHPRPGSIAPPPTPATRNATLALSPPQARTPASSPAAPTPSALRTPTPAKVPPPHPANAAPVAGPSAIKKGPAGGKKIFFISSPESDEDHSSRSRDSKMRVLVTPPSAMKPATAAGRAPGSDRKGKAVVQLEEDDEEDWDSDEDDDDASSGWGSEYSTDSEIARNGAASGSRAGGAGGRANGRPGLDFTKRAPSEMLLRSASTVSMGQPGELKPRPPGLLSQLFHPDQFVEEPERPHSSADVLRRNHKSMSALSSLSQLRPSKSSGVLNAGPRRLEQHRSKSFLRGKPEDVELESSSDEGEEEDEAAAAPDQSAPVSRDEHSSDYEDVDDNASSSAESAAALLARRQRLAAEVEAQAAVLAPPQTPRTTRRAMLATELSESLRRNLLWERQTRNRVMGGAAPRRPMLPGQPLPQRPASSAQLTAPPAPPSATQPPPPGSLAPPASDHGTRAPHPSPATRHSPPIHQAAAAAATAAAGQPRLPRRHTTGTGLYLAAQTNNWGKSRSAASTDSELSQSEDEEEEEEEWTRRGVLEAPAEFFGPALGQRVW